MAFGRFFAGLKPNHTRVANQMVIIRNRLLSNVAQNNCKEDNNMDIDYSIMIGTDAAHGKAT